MKVTALRTAFTTALVTGPGNGVRNDAKRVRAFRYFFYGTHVHPIRSQARGSRTIGSAVAFSPHANIRFPHKLRLRTTRPVPVEPLPFARFGSVAPQHGKPKNGGGLQDDRHRTDRYPPGRCLA